MGGVGDSTYLYLSRWVASDVWGCVKQSTVLVVRIPDIISCSRSGLTNNVLNATLGIEDGIVELLRNPITVFHLLKTLGVEIMPHPPVGILARPQSKTVIVDVINVSIIHSSMIDIGKLPFENLDEKRWNDRVVDHVITLENGPPNDVPLGCPRDNGVPR